ncbi:hypothetical protein QJQ45_009575 [Haematococcus lacustris]|nr:hypothetical protein QJQ45_009575 [Haematococcus lacustris]
MPKLWKPLESNPDVLNEFMAKLGVTSKTHAFTDILGLDPELLNMVPQPVVAVIMCYPITKDSEAAARQEDAEQASRPPAGGADVFFMKQTIGNACGTIALLHSLGNLQGQLTIAPGSFLSHFLAATAGMTPEARGKFLEDPPEGSPDIEAAHQAAAAGGDSAQVPDNEDVNLHFVTFILKDGLLWQLDGRRQGPVCNGPTSPNTLLQDAAAVVKQFAERAKSIHFNLLALAAAETEN